MSLENRHEHVGELVAEGGVTGVLHVAVRRMHDHRVASIVLYSSVPTSAVFANIPSDTVAAARSRTSRPSSTRPAHRKSPSYEVKRSRDHSPNHGYPATTVGPGGVYERVRAADQVGDQAASGSIVPLPVGYSMMTPSPNVSVLAAGSDRLVELLGERSLGRWLAESDRTTWVSADAIMSRYHAAHFDPTHVVLDRILRMCW